MKEGVPIVNPLAEEYDYYLRIREELAKEYEGKFVAIKGQEVLGTYDDYMQAANSVYVAHERGTVLMQEINMDPDAHVVILHTPGIATF